MKVVGLGERKSGVSTKNNKPYDFIPISFIFEDKFTEGFKAATSNVGYDMVEAIGGIKVNKEREMFFHTYNNTIVIDGIL